MKRLYADVADVPANAVNAVKDAVKNAGESALDAAKGAVSNLPGNAGQAWNATKDAVGNIPETAGKAWNSTKEGAANAWNTTKEAAGDLKNKTESTLDGAGSLAKQELDKLKGGADKNNGGSTSSAPFKSPVTYVVLSSTVAVVIALAMN